MSNRNFAAFLLAWFGFSVINSGFLGALFAQSLEPHGYVIGAGVCLVVAATLFYKLELP
jgi:hypothetical protein